jgi:excisionase family DNA binding protein
MVRRLSKGGDEQSRYETLRAEGIDQLLRLMLVVLAAIKDIRSLLTERETPLLSVEEVANITHRSAYTVRRWVAEGRIAAIRVEGTGPRGRLLIARDELAKLVELGLADGVPGAALGGTSR